MTNMITMKSASLICREESRPGERGISAARLIGDGLADDCAPGILTKMR